MSKSIAERFIDWYANQTQELVLSDFVIWLEAQPENQRCFSIDEVEAIVEEGSNISFTSCTMRDPRIFDDWWQAKKAELLGKV